MYIIDFVTPNKIRLVLVLYHEFKYHADSKFWNRIHNIDDVSHVIK